MTHFSVLVELPTPLAYIGPGGGLALLGPLLGLILAVLGALAMIAIWPAKLLWKRLRRGQTTPTETNQ